MAIKLVANYSKRLGLPGYSSHQFSVSVETELRDLDCRAITATQVPKVLNEWRKPAHREFRKRNVWSLFNAVTETHKELNPHTAARRSEALHGLCDGVVRLAN